MFDVGLWAFDVPPFQPSAFSLQPCFVVGRDSVEPKLLPAPHSMLNVECSPISAFLLSQFQLFKMFLSRLLCRGNILRLLCVFVAIDLRKLVSSEARTPQRRRRDIFVEPKSKSNPAPAGRHLLLVVHTHPVTGSARQLSNNKTRETLFLLLGGEGQVEGERHRPKQITGIFLSAENAENADS
jgi:hypothetical protein